MGMIASRNAEAWAARRRPSAKRLARGQRRVFDSPWEDLGGEPTAPFQGQVVTLLRPCNAQEEPEPARRRDLWQALFPDGIERTVWREEIERLAT